MDLQRHLLDRRNEACDVQAQQTAATADWPSVRLLGLEFADLGAVAAAEYLAARPASAPFGYVVTPNADHLVRLARNPALQGAYQRALLCLLDSRVVARFARLLGLDAPTVAPGSDLTAAYTLPGGAKFSDDFHVFAVEWAVNVVRFYVDGNLYETETPANIPAGDTWVYDQPFFILLNVAVGGSWPGDPDSTTVFPQTMLVDYVRVYTAN